MIKFSKILFPVDLSEISSIIAPYVIEIADKLGAEIHILFVARSLTFYRDLLVPASSIYDFEKEIAAGGQSKLKDFVEDAFKGRQVKVEIKRGDPSEIIMEYAKSMGMDMIVMGTHGRKGLDRVLFGSVAEAVVTKANVPVVTINPYRVIKGGLAKSNEPQIDLL
ncbi:MAG: universal stress protein [Deltaproteobacteria bacterium]|nr:universal stress protein [Deltaproteobacteria bacterium]